MTIGERLYYFAHPKVALITFVADENTAAGINVKRGSCQCVLSLRTKSPEPTFTMEYLSRATLF